MFMNSFLILVEVLNRGISFFTFVVSESLVKDVFYGDIFLLRFIILLGEGGTIRLYLWLRIHIIQSKLDVAFIRFYLGRFGNFVVEICQFVRLLARWLSLDRRRCLNYLIGCINFIKGLLL